MNEKKPQHNILILNGPNLNLLGIRETNIYGKESLSDIEQKCIQTAKKLSLHITCQQSNHEGQIIEWIHTVYTHYSGLIINPAALTHTSIAIADAVKAVKTPTIEVHLSNIYQRESYRQNSFISPVASATICGMGSFGYIMALYAINHILASPQPKKDSS